MLQSFQLQEALPSPTPTRGSIPLDPAWTPSQTPVIGSRSALAMVPSPGTFLKKILWAPMLRTSMIQERLVNLPIVSTESDILCEVDSTAIISGFAIAKSRKVSGL